MHAQHDNGKRRRAKTLMIQGTTSNAGKSILVAGSCRVLKRQGQVVTDLDARDFHHYKPRAMHAVLELHQRLADAVEQNIDMGMLKDILQH